MARKAPGTLLFALATALVFSTPAKAVQWIGKFDPLSVLGQGLFQYGDDPSCATDGVHFFDALCNPVILGLTADVTDDNATPSDTSDDSTAHLNFGPLLPANLNDYIISGGQLTGVDTSLIGWVFPTDCTGPNALSVCGPWWFDWLSDFGFDPVRFFTGTCSVDGDFQFCTPDTSAPAVQANNITFAQVPEPATLGLLFAGLGIGWLARRRKRSD